MEGTLSLTDLIGPIVANLESAQPAPPPVGAELERRRRFQDWHDERREWLREERA